MDWEELSHHETIFLFCTKKGKFSLIKSHYQAFLFFLCYHHDKPNTFVVVGHNHTYHTSLTKSGLMRVLTPFVKDESSSTYSDQTGIHLIHLEQHSSAHMAQCERPLQFSILMQLFFSIAPQRFCATESPQYERNTSAETPGSLPEIPAESALIITVFPPKWRQRATAGGEALGFKQYRLQEVQPSLLVVDSDINSNEYLGALPDCLSVNCYKTRGWALEEAFDCVRLCVCRCPCLPVCACDHVCRMCLCVPVHPHASPWVCGFC